MLPTWLAQGHWTWDTGHGAPAEPANAYVHTTFESQVGCNGNDDGNVGGDDNHDDGNDGDADKDGDVYNMNQQEHTHIYAHTNTHASNATSGW